MYGVKRLKAYSFPFLPSQPKVAMLLNSKTSWVAAVLFATVCFDSAVSDEPKGPLIGFAQSRNWSDASGAFSIPAKLAWADKKEVKLTKSDGRTITVPLNKLSEADQKFVNGFLQAEAALDMGGSTDALPDSANPFAGGVPSGSSPKSGSSPGATEASGSIPMREASIKGLRPISVSPGKEFWDVPTLHGFPAVEFQELVVPTLIKKPFFAAFRIQAAGRTGNVVLNAYQQGRGNKENYTDLSVVNATTGDTTETLHLDTPWKVMDVSADGSRIAAVRIVGFDKGSDVALMRITANGIVPEYQFTAGGGSWDELHFAKFLPGNRLMTISQKHNLTVWDIGGDSVRAVSRGNSGGKLWAALSPAGEAMAVVAGKSIAFIDTVKFKLVGYIPREEEPLALAFSPDGKQLASYHRFAIDIYSMESGQLDQSFAVAESDPKTRLHWTGDHLMVGSVLYDPAKGVPLWTYESSKSRATLGSYLFSAFPGDNGTTLTVFRLPHDEAIRAADDIDPDNIYCISPGDRVAIDYQISQASSGIQQEIRNAVESKVAELGWELSTSGANKILIKLEKGKQEESEYYTRRGFGPAFFPGGFGPRPSGPADKVTYQPWTHTFSITSVGDQVYNAVRKFSAPQSLSTKDGETTQQAVNRYCRPTPTYFKSLIVPPHILKSEFQGGLGKTKITASGMQ